MRAIHQDSDILAAGERLRAERPGGAVSAWDILKELGGRGKLERVQRLWAARLAAAENEVVVPPVVGTPLPPRLAEARDADLARVTSSLDAVQGVVSSLYATTWTVADEVAQGRVAAERKTYSDQRDEYERQEALARELQSASEIREEALEVRVDGLNGELAQARTDATRLTERVAAAEAEAARAAERATAEAGRLSASLSSMEAALAEARREVATASATATAAQAEAERARSETAVVRLDLERAVTSLSEARREAASASTSAAAAQTEAERTRAETAAVRLDLEAARGQKTDLSTRLATAEAKASALSGELERERQIAAAAAEAARGDLGRLRQDLDVAKEAKAAIEASLAASEARAEVVARELERERQEKASRVPAVTE